jgi:hypothetical protein
MSGEEATVARGFDSTTLAKEWLAGGVANAVTSAIVNPLDVSKTRIQVLQSKVAGDVVKAGLSNSGALRKVVTDLYAEGGILGLWKPGLQASMLREILYSGLRTGFYVPVRDSVNLLMGSDDSEDGSDISLSKKIVSAMITGTMGSLLANPVDIVKIRLMINPNIYSTSWSGMRTVYNTEGFAGMYRGILPSTLRAAFIAAGELATYDHTKVMLKKHLSGAEGPQHHLIASFVTGLVATTVAAPFDVIKTRTMNSTGNIGAFRILYDTVRQEGLFALYRGWVPAYFRLGPHAMICFPIFEQLRRLFGLSYL